MSYFLIGVAKFSCILLTLFIGTENVLHSYFSTLLKIMCQKFLKINNSISFKVKINFIKSTYTFLIIANTNETRHFDELASSNVKK